MDKQMLRCDICGGELEIQGDGKVIYAFCGMKYYFDSLREKLNDLIVCLSTRKKNYK